MLLSKPVDAWTSVAINEVGDRFAIEIKVVEFYAIIGRRNGLGELGFAQNH